MVLVYMADSLLSDCGYSVVYQHVNLCVNGLQVQASHYDIASKEHYVEILTHHSDISQEVKASTQICLPNGQ